MKRKILPILMGLALLCPFISLEAQEFKLHISREFLPVNIESSILYIYNLNGSLKVDAYSGNKVLLEIDQTLSAENEKELEIGKKEFRLAFEQQNDTFMAYIAAPFDSRPRRNWHYSDDRENVKYNYHLDFVVKVPNSMNLHISTVNEGDILVSKVKGNLHVSNVNGAITIFDAASTTYAHTVNGDVTINYLKNPSEESSYYTINGNIRVNYQQGLSADMQFKSMQGDFYTDFPDAALLPPSVSRIREEKNGTFVYKINAFMAVRFGNGGRTFKFETLNGNVYIKKQS
jgi:hypothetical protein